MKKILIFFIFIYHIGCSGSPDQGKKAVIIDCPRVFFSSENNVYVDGGKESIDLENVNYRASLNNYGFVGDCTSNIDYNKFNLELLIIAEPFNPKDDHINLPIFVLTYDSENILIDKQYFRIEDNLKYNNENSNYEITEVIGNLNIILELEKELDSITIGFVNIK